MIYFLFFRFLFLFFLVFKEVDVRACVHVCVLCVCMSYAYGCPWVLKRGHHISLGVMDSCELPSLGAGTRSGPLE